MGDSETLNMKDKNMSTAMATEADFRFFDFLAPYRWPDKNQKQITIYRELVKNGDLELSTVLENALAQCSRGRYQRTATAYRDFSDGSDAKKVVSQFRNNHIAKKQWTNSFAISGLAKKEGLIRAVCYSIYNDRFYFYAIPHRAYRGRKRIDITLDCSIGYREPKGIPKGKWCCYQVESFERLATITPAEVERRFSQKNKKWY